MVHTAALKEQAPVVQRLAVGWRQGELLRREKRFTAWVRLSDGELVGAHCVNTGSMRGCLSPPQPALVTPATAAGRKLAWTLEMIQHGLTWVDVNTQRANALFAALVEKQLLPGIPIRGTLRREVRFRDSRFDFCLEDGEAQPVWIEVKQVTMSVNGEARFPDAVSLRGQKHLNALAEICRQGGRAWAVYLIKRSDCHSFGPAADIDPAYARALREAEEVGVRVLPLSFAVAPGELRFLGVLPRCVASGGTC